MKSIPVLRKCHTDESYKIKSLLRTAMGPFVLGAVHAVEKKVMSIFLLTLKKLIKQIYIVLLIVAIANISAISVQAQPL
jgi:hypothetical protein